MPGFVDAVGLIVDGIFGFSFEGVPRAPWDVILRQLKDPEQFGRIPMVSIDIPSGWEADSGPPPQPTQAEIDGGAKPFAVLQPDVLISLTAPKRAALKFEGMHYLGLRNIPFAIKEKFELNTPSYVGAKTYTTLSKLSPERVAELEGAVAKEEALSTVSAGEILGIPLSLWCVRARFVLQCTD